MTKYKLQHKLGDCAGDARSVEFEGGGVGYGEGVGEFEVGFEAFEEVVEGFGGEEVGGEEDER